MAPRDAADGTYFLDGPLGLRGALDAALAHVTAPGEVDRFRRAHSWEHRFDEARLAPRLQSVMSTARRS
jgi:hypothetical protein